MNHMFELLDKTKRKIRLTKEQWQHIRKKHPEIEDCEEIELTLKEPTKITLPKLDEGVGFYYKYFKNKSSRNYLLVLVKYLNGDGHVITEYYEDKIT